MNKKDLSERDICTKFITPSLKNASAYDDAIHSLTDELYKSA